MQTKRKTMIVAGATKGIGAGVTKAFIGRGYNGVANSLNITAFSFAAMDRLAVVRRDVGDPSSAHEIALMAIETDGSIDAVLRNGGVFFSKPSTEYKPQDFEKHNASLAMVEKGGRDAIRRSLAMEYAKENMRFNAVAPGVVNTPMADPLARAELAQTFGRTLGH